MAAELVAGALLSASLQVLFERLASEEIPQLFQGKKPILDLLDELKIVLSSAKVLLNDAEEKQIRNDEVRTWLFNLQEVIYAADDLVDRIDYEALRSKLEGDQSSSRTSKVFMKLVPTLFTAFDNTIKHDATEILRRLKILVDQKDVLGLREVVQNKPSQRPPAPLVEESDVFGREADKEVIVDLLLSDDVSGNKISVIPIVGMGGIGKTTLAQLVYDDDRVQKHFELKSWVTVSDDFDIFKITKTIFEAANSEKCVNSEKCENMSLFELQRRLKEAVRGKKFLFVHDDVWNENYHLWDALKSSFESGAVGSKIVVTTRSENVASIMTTGLNRYLTNLSNEDCWQLFVKHAFGSNFDLNAYHDLQVIGREIVNKCKGLPLAIKSLGGLLRFERNPKKWEDILNNEVWDEFYKKEGTILPALWLSYRHLPTYLKRCFAYCSIFPKDYEIEKEKLILLWMAEVLFQSDRKSKRLEEVGEGYFYELLSRSLLQKSSKQESIILMHDLVHDLAMFVSGEFFFRLDLSNDLHSLSSKTHHLSYSLGTYELNKFKGLCKARCLRTFVALPLKFPKWPIYPNYLVPFDLLLTTGSCLRVFSLSQSSIKELPDSISCLKHLRYLDLSFTEIRELPDSICNFYHLQTLLLSWCKNLSRLPKNMGRLINLRHLDIEGVPLEEMPPHITNLKYLRTLSQVVLGYEQSGFKIKKLNEFEHLHGKLAISGLENIVDAAEASEGNLKDRKSLSKIHLRWNANAGVADSSQKEKEVLDALRPHTNLTDLEIESYRGTMFSDWIVDYSFCNLTSIWLRNCKSCWILPPVGQLPSLKDLRIDGFDSVVSVGDEIEYSGPLFRSLEMLRIENMLMWKEWSFKEAIREGQIFPVLKTLYLENCPKLNVGLPCYLPSLEDLRINNCEEMVVLLPRSKQGTVTASPSLVSIQISDCPALESLLDWGSHSRLKTLQLLQTKMLSRNRMHLDLQRLSCLELLNISGWEDDSFPDEGLLPTTLTKLWIQSFSNLETLNGKAFQQLNSLRHLFINRCKSLRCLPEEGLPTSLSLLDIMKCPLLKKRCEKDGEDWPKIAHIPSLILRDHW